MKTSITHAAMDTHKKQHQVAWVHPDTGEIQQFTVPNTAQELGRMVKRIRKQSPGEIHVCYEADRELTRCRQSAQEDLKQARQRLNSFLIRNGYIYQEGSHWTDRHGRWLQGLAFDQPMLRTVFEEYLSQIEHGRQRLASLDKQVQSLAQSDRYRSMVGALRCLRGIDTLTAVTRLTEIFDFGRFDSPRALTAYLGVTPSEDSSGEKRRPGAITKTGNRRARRILTEAAWHYRHRYRVSKALKLRRQDQPPWAVDLVDHAAKRLYRRYHHLTERGKASPVAIMAVVRELAGFVWAMLRQLQPPQSPSP